MTEPDFLLDLRTRWNTATLWPSKYTSVGRVCSYDLGQPQEKISKPLEEKQTTICPSSTFPSRSEEEFKMHWNRPAARAGPKHNASGGHASDVRHLAEKTGRRIFSQPAQRRSLTPSGLAGKIQTTSSGVAHPAAGWGITARWNRAGRLQGFLRLFPHRSQLGIVAADVTDKGIGAALFIGLSSTLIRTYALVFLPCQA
jgi:hypothetical protein